MALVKYGGGIIQMSGSIAGNTYARNRFGNYARARTKPTNPNSSPQQSVRSAVSDAVGRWANTLTAAQRTAWNLYADSVDMLNRLGETVQLSGFNHYVRSNSILIRDGHTPVDDGPTIFSLPEADGDFAISISEATQLISVVFDDTLDWCDEDDAFMFVFMGRPQNPQRNFFAGPWLFADTIDGDSVAAPTTPETLACPIVCTEGQRVWAYARIALPDGRLSTLFRADCFCAA